jgi:hypothetical protein
VCTVSIVAWAGGLRLVANRDEQRSRAAALPPRVVERDGIRALMPIDPASGGSWTAVNELGIAFALLNVNPSVPFEPGARSRGEIVAAVASLASIDAVLDLVERFDRGRHAPFRLICAAGGEALELAPHLSLMRRHALRRPLMFASSGLGDDRVEAPRRALFAELVGGADAREPVDDLCRRQDAFHAHRWSDAPHLSVFMSREDACTVSRTVIDVRERSVAMTYAGAPGWESSALTMTRARGGQRADRRR